MFIKLLLQVFFEKKKVAIAFVIICAILTCYIAIQNALTYANLDGQTSMPDILFTGTIYHSEDGSYPFKAFNGISGFNNVITEMAENNVDNYGVVCRSIYNYYDQMTSIGFSGYVYGVPDKFLNDYFSNYLIEGSLPKEGKREAVVGYYFAKRFDITIGDPIPQTITLNEHWTEEDVNVYIVSGILTENIDASFVGSTIISRETFENLTNSIIEDNMIMGYFKGKDSELNQDIFLSINKLAEQFKSPEGKYNFLNKSFALRKIFLNIIVYVAISVVILFILISYLIKGLTKKIGILKALGVSHWNIVKVFIGGLGAFIVSASLIGVIIAKIFINALNRYISNFYGFETQVYRINSMTFILVGCEILFFVLIVFTFIYAKCMEVSPRVAMISID